MPNATPFPDKQFICVHCHMWVTFYEHMQQWRHFDARTNFVKECPTNVPTNKDGV